MASKEQLAVMNSEDEIDVKEFKDEIECNVFKEACEIKKKENISTCIIEAPSTPNLNNPHAKSPSSYASIDTKRGGLVKKMIDGGNSTMSPSSLGKEFEANATSSTFSENLKKSAVKVTINSQPNN